MYLVKFNLRKEHNYIINYFSLIHFKRSTKYSIQRNLSKADTFGTNNIVRFRQVSSFGIMRLWPANWNFGANEIEIPVLFMQVSALEHIRFGQVSLYVIKEVSIELPWYDLSKRKFETLFSIWLIYRLYGL